MVIPDESVLYILVVLLLAFIVAHVSIPQSIPQVGNRDANEEIVLLEDIEQLWQRLHRMGDYIVWYSA